MALPGSNISLSQINAFLGRSSTASLSFDDYYFRFIANQFSGSVSISNCLNKFGGGGTLVLGYGSSKSGDYQYANSSYPPTSFVGNINGVDVASNYGNFYYNLNDTVYFQVNVDWGSTTASWRARIGSGAVFTNWYPDGYGNLLNYNSYPSASGTQPYNTTLTWIAVRN